MSDEKTSILHKQNSSEHQLRSPHSHSHRRLEWTGARHATPAYSVNNSAASKGQKRRNLVFRVELLTKGQCWQSLELMKVKPWEKPAMLDDQGEDEISGYTATM